MSPWIGRTASQLVLGSVEAHFAQVWLSAYPPDLQDAAVQTVLQQAEALTGLWQSV